MQRQVGKTVTNKENQERKGGHRKGLEVDRQKEERETERTNERQETEAGSSTNRITDTINQLIFKRGSDQSGRSQVKDGHIIMTPVHPSWPRWVVPSSSSQRERGWLVTSFGASVCVVLIRR